jgi:hypothetical protein
MNTPDRRAVIAGGAMLAFIGDGFRDALDPKDR